MSKESKKRIHASMVLNPEDGDGGPVYDSINPQYETLSAVTPPRFTETHQGSSSVIKSSHSDDVDVTCCVDQSVQLPQFRSQSFPHSCYTTITDNIDRENPSRLYCNSISLYYGGPEGHCRLHISRSIVLRDCSLATSNFESPIS